MSELLSTFIDNAQKTIFKNDAVYEADIENEFCEYAKTKNCNALKLALINRRGFPDRTILCPNSRVFFIEFKRKNKKQNAIQKNVQRTLEKSGFTYYVCDDIDTAKYCLDAFLTR